MATTYELYTQSLLAQAAYADLAIGPIVNTTSLIDDAGMAAAQANDFASAYNSILGHAG